MDWTKIRRVSKAIAGAIVAGAAGTGTAAIAVPENVMIPWYGYIAIAVINAGIGYIGVYAAPKNKPSAAEEAAARMYPEAPAPAGEEVSARRGGGLY